MERPEDEKQLDSMLSEPTEQLVEFMAELEGDIAVLGVAGKMGKSLGEMAVRSSGRAGVDRTVYGVSRFSSPGSDEAIRQAGIKPVKCDLLDRESVKALPDAPNVIFMAGRKFGTDGQEDITWAMNTLAPAHASERYSGSRIAAFSTGCVYPLVDKETGGCTEADAPGPVGEYAQSCLGRERIFEYFSRKEGTPVVLLRLNYAVEMRYGVLHDLAARIVNEEPVDLAVGLVNVIWQADANAQALLALGQCSSPPAILNVTGPELLSVRELAEAMGEELGERVRFTGEEGSAAYLSDSSKAAALFGCPRIDPWTLAKWTARWVAEGKPSLGKPTHFEVKNGRY
jgi:nucleoside-diphosphate-sugar epimerase